MKFKFKHILYILLMIIPAMQTPAVGGTLKVEKIISPVNFGNKVSQPINLSFAADGYWKLVVEPLDSQIVNQDNPRYSLPLTRLEIAEMSGFPISNFANKRIIDVKSGDMAGVNNLRLAINVITNDCDRPGNYTACLKFTLYGHNSVIGEDIYNFRFLKNEISSIDFPNRVVRLNLDKDKILQKNITQNLPAPLGVYIRSNKNWKLYLRRLPDSRDKELNYFVKVMGGDSSINFNQANEYVQINDNTVLLATGKATINDMSNCLDRKLINIDYMIKGPENKFISAGERTEEFEYRLETED